MDLSPGQLQALRIAARQTHRTPPEERVERHPLGRQYVRELAEAGLLGYTLTAAGTTLEVTQEAVGVLRAYWTGRLRSGPVRRGAA